MLFVSLLDYANNLQNIPCDGFEIRLDALPSLEIEKLSSFLQSLKKPLIFTLRKKSQGGFFLSSEKERLSILEDLCQLNPTYIDIEYDTDPGFIKRIHQKFPQIKIILSYHDFEKTPQDLFSLFQSLIIPEAFAYKIATHANSSLDALRMVDFVKKNASSYKLSGLCMGEEDKITRILGPVISNFIDYAALDDNSKSAEGQLTLEELMTSYQYESLNPKTLLFGLIGDPVRQSLSSFTHNLMFRHHHVNALYLKMGILPENLLPSLVLLQKIGFSGLSVTMPHKQTIYPLVQKVIFPADQIKAINTLVIKEGQMIGYNTDGIGCIKAIQNKTPIKNKKILILGAGGAAKAIAYEALNQEAIVYIYNRTHSKATDLVKTLKLPEKHALQDLEGFSYDILINATASFSPLDPQSILAHTYVMDIHTRPKMSSFLIEAEKKQCILIFGYEMFTYQALEQFQIWLNQRFDKKVLEEACLDQL